MGGSPELVLEGADLTVHGIGGLGGVLQLTLKLPAGGVGPLGLLLGLLQLSLELLQAGGCLVSLRRHGHWPLGARCRWPTWSLCSAGKHTWSLYCSAFLRSSSTCSSTSFSFFSARRTCLQAAWRSLRGTDMVAQEDTLQGVCPTNHKLDNQSGSHRCFPLREALMLRRPSSFPEHPRCAWALLGGSVISPFHR